MRNSRTAEVVVCAVLICSALTAGFTASASASDASIKAVLKSFNSKILVAEGHVVSAIGEYKKTGNPTAVRGAIGKSIIVLDSLKNKVSVQSASSGRVKAGKAKLVKGLTSVVSAYKKLSIAFGEKKVSPAAAKAEAVKAVSAVKKGRTELREAVKLLE
jgi:hypothetical protein